MSNVTKIALTGKLRSGKSEVAKHLYFEHGFAFPVSFGDKLKSAYRDLLPWLPADVKRRKDLQDFGQLMRERFDADIWVKHAAETVAFLENDRGTTGIVIDDLRQPNEYAWLRANGFTIIRVTAPDDVRMARAIDAGDDFTVHDFAHDTELHVDGFAVDAEIVNDGTVEELRRKVDEVLAKLEAVI